MLRLYYLVVFAAFGAMVPFFPSWLEARGVRGAHLGLVTGVMPIAGLLGPMLFGYLADRFALRGRLIRIACVGAVASVGSLAVLGALGQAVGVWAMLLLIAAFSFFRAPLVMVADVSALESAKSYGRVRLFGSAGFAITALGLGGVLDVTDAVELPAFVTVTLIVTGLVSISLPAKVARRPAPVLGALRRLLRRPRFRRFLLLTLAWFAGHSAYDLVIGRHIEFLGGNEFHIGLAWGVGVVAEIALMALSPRWIGRVSTARLLTIAMTANVARWMLLALAPNLGLVLLLSPLHALSFGLTWLAALEFLRTEVPKGIEGSAQATFTGVAAIGRGSAAVAWGVVYEVSGGATVFYIATLIALVGVAFAMAIRRTDEAQ